MVPVVQTAFYCGLSAVAVHRRWTIFLEADSRGPCHLEIPQWRTQLLQDVVWNLSFILVEVAGAGVLSRAPACICDDLWWGRVQDLGWAI